jgi:hypothetical protein
VSQISPPIRILLIGAVVFLAAWFTVLKPKDGAVAPVATAPAPAATPASTAGDFKAKAQAGAAKAEADAAGAANATLEDGATGSAAATPSRAATASATKGGAASAAVEPLPAKAVAGLPRAVRSALADRKVIVLGVVDTTATGWDSASAEDLAVRDALRGANRYGGEVVVRTVPVSRVEAYDGMMQALGVSQSPTVVVIDRNRQAVTLPGWVDRAAVDQAIVDARRSSTTRLLQTAFQRETNRLCGRYALRLDRLGVRGTGAQRAAWTRGLSRLAGEYTRAFARVSAPASRRALRARIVAGVRADVTRTRSLGDAPDAGVLASLSPALERAGLTSCTATRTR